MSMDLEVWSERAFDIPSWLPFANQWTAHGSEWALERDGWQLLVSTEEDVDAQTEVLDRLPRARHRASVTLEPIGADEAGYVLLEAVVRGLAQQANGVWVDPNGHVLSSTELPDEP